MKTGKILFGIISVLIIIFMLCFTSCEREDCYTCTDEFGVSDKVCSDFIAYMRQLSGDDCVK
jgi:hypothetical protein